MIEKMLEQAAAELPKPQSAFSVIEERAHTQRQKPHHIHRYRKIAAALICVIALLTITVAASNTVVKYSAWATRTDRDEDVQEIAEKLNVVLPEALGDCPFYNMTTMHVVEPTTTYLEAITTPIYCWYSLDYGVREVVRTYDTDDPDSGYMESVVVKDGITLNVGSTDGELWNYCFSMNENGILIPSEDVIPENSTTEEYNGIILQMQSTVLYDETCTDGLGGYHHRVKWVDTQRNAVFSLVRFVPAGEEDWFPEELINLAKEIVELNRTEG